MHEIRIRRYVGKINCFEMLGTKFWSKECRLGLRVQAGPGGAGLAARLSSNALTETSHFVFVSPGYYSWCERACRRSYPWTIAPHFWAWGRWTRTRQHQTLKWKSTERPTTQSTCRRNILQTHNCNNRRRGQSIGKKRIQRVLKIQYPQWATDNEQENSRHSMTSADKNESHTTKRHIWGSRSYADTCQGRANRTLVWTNGKHKPTITKK